MKVHIINLDPEDDHASVRDKISWARGPKVILVWPRRGRPLGRRLDLTIVQRHAGRLGLELGLVTFDPAVISHAEALEIPIFESLEKLPPGTWIVSPKAEITRRERPSLAELREARDPGAILQLGERGRQIAVGISVAAVLALAISILPSAEIVMEPLGIPMEESLSIWIDPLPPATSSRVPGQAITAEISGSNRIDTSGRIRLPQVASSGEIRITNLTGEEISVPAGSGLRAGEIRFLTSDEVRLEAGEGSSATVSIEAAEAGISGNVGAEAIDSVEGPLGFLITASNPEPTAGGRDQVAASVGVRDMESLREQLELELIEGAESTLLAQLDRGFDLVPGSLRITEVVDEHYDVGLGEAAQSLGLSLTLNIEGLGYSVPLVLEAAEQEILSGLPANRLLIPGSLSLEAIDAESDWPAMEVLFALKGSLAKNIDRDLLRRTVLGDPKAQAAARLEELLDLDQAPRIKTAPVWMPWVPWLGMRIDIKWAWESA